MNILEDLKKRNVFHQNAITKWTEGYYWEKGSCSFVQNIFRGPAFDILTMLIAEGSHPQYTKTMSRHLV